MAKPYRLMRRCIVLIVANFTPKIQLIASLLLLSSVTPEAAEWSWAMTTDVEYYRNCVKALLIIRI